MISKLVGVALDHAESSRNALKFLRSVIGRPATFLLFGTYLAASAANCRGAQSPVEKKFEASHRSWTFLATSANGDAYYYYNENLIQAPDGKTVTIWTKRIDLKKIENVYGSKAPDIETYLLAHTATKYKIYCDKEMLEILENFKVDEGGKRSSLGGRGEREPIIPDTVGHAFYNAACYSSQNVFTKIWRTFVREE